MSWGSVIAGLVCIGGMAYVGVNIAKDMVNQYEEKQKMKELTRYDIKVKITNYKTTYKGEQKAVDNSQGEYHYWDSDDWFYIDKQGNKINQK